MAKPALRTKLCDILGIEYPVVLAGMFQEQRPAGEILEEIVGQAAEVIQRLPVDIPAVTS